MVEKIQGHGKMVMDISNNNTFLYSRYIIYIYISIDTRPTHFKNNSLNIKDKRNFVCTYMYVCVPRIPGTQVQLLQVSFFYLKKTNEEIYPGNVEV